MSGHDKIRLPVSWTLAVATVLAFVPAHAGEGADFSQVEADALQLDINEPFTLYYPETRPFFKEGADYFDTPLNLVHTRTVSDPDGALKLTGKEGRHTFAVFSANDRTTSLVLPGAESFEVERFRQETNATVARYRYDIGGVSSVGGTVTSRSGGGYFNRVASAESQIRFTEADQLNMDLAASETRYNAQMAGVFGVGDEPLSGDALFMQFQHTKRNGWVEVDAWNLDAQFRSDLGFRSQVDYRETWAGGARIGWGEEGDLHRRMAWGAGVGNKERQDGGLLRDKVETWFNVNLPRQSYVEVNLTSQSQGFGGDDYTDQLRYSTYAESQLTKNLSMSLRYVFGDGIDFDNARPARVVFAAPGLKYNLGRHILFECRHQHLELNFAGGELFHVNAPEARIVYQINARAFVRGIFQYKRTERDPALYASQVDRTSRDLFSQLLSTYQCPVFEVMLTTSTDGFLVDVRRLLGPYERCRVLVPVLDVAADVSDELPDGGEGSATGALASHDAEPGLDHVQPRCPRRGEVESDVGMSFEFGKLTITKK